VASAILKLSFFTLFFFHNLSIPWQMAKILLVDDEPSIRKILREILEFENYTIDEAADGMECLIKVQRDKPDVVILDIKMPKMDGMEALDRLQIIAPEIPVIMISGHATIDIAVQAVQKGAFDFIQKPPDMNRILITVRNALDKHDLISTTQTLVKKISKSKCQEIIGNSKPILDVKEMIDRVAPMNTRVMILGQNGTGKELVARWLHAKSSRANNALIEVNCAAIPSELIESELFGHVKGSFTGAIKDHAGKFEQANNGTIFLDEIGDMSLAAQAKVLRALNDNKISRVGGEKEIKVDVRVLAATNKDLRREIAEGRFREDLFHRIAVVQIRVPALNDRRIDIPLLVETFNKRISEEAGHPPKKFSKDAMAALQNYDWTGNIRELSNVVERLHIFCDNVVTEEDVMKFVYWNKEDVYA
jgi:two-component system, NtrC family, nitrogen regulation response regulator NtrX